MKKRRTTPKARKPPPAGRVSPSPEVQLQYKVVELSNVDEQSLERTVNTWVRQGYRLENVQFAMRESSKRPSMAFVFFTREVPVVASADPVPEPPRPELPLAPVRSISAYERLVQLAEGDDDAEPGR